MHRRRSQWLRYELFRWATRICWRFDGAPTFRCLLSGRFWCSEEAGKMEMKLTSNVIKLTLTLINSKMTMHEKPKTVSDNLMPSMLWTIARHISTKVVPPPFIPKMSFICDDKMINATALVKPDDTGPETKSMRKPSPKNPMRSSVSPVMKQSRTAFCQLPRAVWKVKSDAIAVGPENYEIIFLKS